MQLMDFDAHRLDPLGGLNLVEADFAWETTRLVKIAEKHGKAASSRFSKAAITSKGSPAPPPRMWRR